MTCGTGLGSPLPRVRQAGGRDAPAPRRQEQRDEPAAVRARSVRAGEGRARLHTSRWARRRSAKGTRPSSSRAAPGLSIPTVTTHVSHVLTKLELNNRVRIALVVHRPGPL
ncbi:hypothetical protein ACWC4J_36625 [Streptomyces sp. NPDC001356]